MRSFIDCVIFYENAEKDENGDALIYEDVVLDMTPEALPPREKGSYPSSEMEQLEVRHLTNIDEKLKASNRKVYAIEKDTERLKQKLKKFQKVSSIEKSEENWKIKSLLNLMRLKKEKAKLDTIPVMNGFANVAAFKKALKKAKEKLQEEWNRLDPKLEAVYWRVYANAKREQVKEQRLEKKRGIKERLAEKKMEIEKWSSKPKRQKSRDRDCL